MGKLPSRLVQLAGIICLAFYHVAPHHLIRWTLDTSPIPSGFNETWTWYWGRPMSQLECSRVCGRHGGCLTVAYVQQTLTCRLYNQEITPDTELLQPAGGHVQYYKVLPCLRPDFVYKPALNTCVKVHDSQWLTHADATSVCEQEGGHMFKFNVTAAYNFMANIVANTGISEFWLGGTRSATNPDDHHWVTGELITPLSGAQFWLPGQPVNQTEKNCLIFTDSFLPDVGMRVVRCEPQRVFVCQRAPKW